jgi:uncharacterized membrane protein
MNTISLQPYGHKKIIMIFEIMLIFSCTFFLIMYFLALKNTNKKLGYIFVGNKSDCIICVTTLLVTFSVSPSLGNHKERK